MLYVGIYSARIVLFLVHTETVRVLLIVFVTFHAGLLICGGVVFSGTRCCSVDSM